MRLIDADALKNALIECTPYAIDPVYRNTNSNIDMFTAMEILDELPTIDAVPVVRCGECDRRIKSADLTNTVLCGWFRKITMNKDDFCSYGAKMEDKT